MERSMADREPNFRVLYLQLRMSRVGYEVSSTLKQHRQRQCTWHWQITNKESSHLLWKVETKGWGVPSIACGVLHYKEVSISHITIASHSQGVMLLNIGEAGARGV